MAKPLEQSEWLHRVRITPELKRELERHVELFRRTHPNANVSAWVREAIDEKMRREAAIVAEKRPKKRSA